MELLWLVTLLAGLQCAVFAGLVGAARAGGSVAAPAVTGDEKFERRFRVHYNTLEQLAVFYPGLWGFGMFVDSNVAAGLGFVYLIGRIIYFRQYTARPASRAIGFGLSALPCYALVIGGVVGVVWRLIG